MAYTQAERLALLNTRIDTIHDELAELTKSTIGGKPNTTGGAEGIDHVGHRKALLDELDRLLATKRKLELELAGPWIRPS